MYVCADHEVVKIKICQFISFFDHRSCNEIDESLFVPFSLSLSDCMRERANESHPAGTYILAKWIERVGKDMMIFRTIISEERKRMSHPDVN